MSITEDIQNDLALFRADIFVHYQNIAQDFEADIQSTVPDVDKISGNAAYLALVQVFLAQIDDVIPQVEKNEEILQSLFQTGSSEEVARYFLTRVYDALEQTAEDDEFRTTALEIAFEATPYADPDTFHSAFDAVLDWVKSSINNAEDIIKEHKYRPKEQAAEDTPAEEPQIPKPPKLH
ncbi:MAG: hypothetical protein H6867_04070 [Rhodospirillales bacterium]|nr:hypothetical protein [Rhodospirillales bacterium]MCB9996327.1 hypothetical protein [Rhodospirillales bacterium]